MLGYLLGSLGHGVCGHSEMKVCTWADNSASSRAVIPSSMRESELLGKVEATSSQMSAGEEVPCVLARVAVREGAANQVGAVLASY